MLATSYDYAIIRVVPSVERGECINVGVILFCRPRRYLDMLIHVDETRLRALARALDFVALEKQLKHMLVVCHGEPESGPIGALSQSERFHWLVSPRSTIIQTSPVHSGLCEDDPAAILRSLQEKLVL